MVEVGEVSPATRARAAHREADAIPRYLLIAIAAGRGTCPAVAGSGTSFTTPGRSIAACLTVRDNDVREPPATLFDGRERVFDTLEREALMLEDREVEGAGGKHLGHVLALGDIEPE